MSKVLTDKEVLAIVKRIVVDNELDDSDVYEAFLRDIGDVVAKYMGGELVAVSRPLFEKSTDESSNRFCLFYRHDECVPEGGGVYADYDTDVSVEEWIADSKTNKN